AKCNGGCVESYHLEWNEGGLVESNGAEGKDISYPRKIRWCGTRGKFVRLTGVKDNKDYPNVQRGVLWRRVSSQEFTAVLSGLTSRSRVGLLALEGLFVPLNGHVMVRGSVRWGARIISHTRGHINMIVLELHSRHLHNGQHGIICEYAVERRSHKEKIRTVNRMRGTAITRDVTGGGFYEWLEVRGVKRVEYLYIYRGAYETRTTRLAE
ncbi:hypothetical protein Tco_0485412, partial [Tanacetum coccineum]